MDTIFIGQLNALVQNLPVLAAPAIVTPPYLSSEIVAGDPIATTYAYTDGTASLGYPAGTVAPAQVLVAGTNQGTSYTTTDSDVGKTVQIRDTVSSVDFPSAVTAVSAAITIQARQTFASMGYLGGNVSGTVEYSRIQLFADAIGDSRGWCVPNTNSNYWQPAGVAIPTSGLTFGATSGTGVTLQISSASLSPLNGDQSDIGKVFLLRTTTTAGLATSSYGNGGRAVVIGFVDTQNCVVTITTTLAQTSWSNSSSQLWECSVMTLSFSAATGNGVTMVIGGQNTYADSNSLAGAAVGRIFTVTQILPNNQIVALGTATVVSVTNLWTAVVNITSGSMPLNGTPSLSWGVSIPLDSNGMPTISAQIVISASPGGVGSGQLNNGSSYNIIFSSPGGATVCTAQNSSNMTLGSAVLQPDGVTKILPFSLGAGTQNTSVSVLFNGPVTSISVPRDGSTNIPTQEFNSTCLAYHSQLPRLRFMDWLNMNGSGFMRPDITWALAGADWKIMQRMFGHQIPSWQLYIRFCNALFAYPGSKLQEVDFNLPPFAVADYAAQLSTLFTNYAPSGAIAQGLIKLYPNGANEPWNSSFLPLNSYTAAAVYEAQVLTQYAMGSSPFASVSQTGTTVTVVLNLTPAQIAATYNGLVISTSSLLYVADGTSLWNNKTIGSPCKVTSVSSTSTQTTFQYTSANSQTLTLNTADQFAIFFNTTSNLVADGTSFNVFDLSHKYYVRQVFGYKQAWTRSQDRFYLNVGFGQYADGISGGGNAIKVEYPYAAYLGGGTASWLYGASAAPYVTPTLHCDATNGSAVLSNFADTTSGSTTANAIAAGAVILDPSLYYAAGDTLNIPSGGSTTSYTVQSVTAGVGGTVTLTAPYTGSTQQRIACTINGPSPSSAANGRLWAAATANLNGPIARQILNHIGFCKLYGLHPLAYEGGPDLQNAPLMNISAATDPAAGTFVTALADKWFKYGGEQFTYYTFSPSSFANQSQGSWNICQDYTDTTSPKLVAWLNYSTQRGYASDIGAPGTVTYVNSWWASSGVASYSSGNVAFTNSAVRNTVDAQRLVPRSRRFAIDFTATVAGTPLTVSFYANPTNSSDGTFLGTTTIPANGAGTSTTAAACVEVPASVELPHGMCLIRAAVAANAPGQPGFGSIALRAA